MLNEGAGNQQDTSLQQSLEEQLSAHGWNFETLIISDDIEKQLKQYQQTHRVDRIIAAGGDGTINLASKYIHGTLTELAIIPTGSANGMARELQIPLDIPQAIQLAATGTAWPIDILCLNGEHFCLHLSDIGLNAKIVKRFEEDAGRGMWGYVKQFFRELWHTHTSKFTFRLPNGSSFSCKAYMVIMANASQYGTGAVINPDAKLDDGRFELSIMRRMPLRGMIRLLFSMWLGNVKRHPWTTVHSYEELTIINEGKRMVQTDGEVLGRLEEVHIKAYKQALRVVNIY